MSDYFIGLDLGFTTDFSALSIIERYFEREYEYFEEFQKPYFNLTYLERFQVPYPEIAQKIRILFEDSRLRRAGVLVVDATGVGLPIVQMLESEEVKPVPIIITSGEMAVESKDGWNVPKKHLVSSLVALLQSGRLKIAADLELAKIFVEELQNFSYKIDRKTGHESYEAKKEQIHDDLTVAVALAAWYAIKDGIQKRKIIKIRRGESIRHYEVPPLFNIGNKH